MNKKTKSKQVVFDPQTEVNPQEFHALPAVKLSVTNAPDRKMVSIRLKEDVIDGLKNVARRKGIPYQVLIQMWLQERLLLETRHNEQPQPLVRLRQLSSELQQVVEGLGSMPFG